ncbi:hypothetical protein DEO72_LG11g1923 [Vigna unguiculata]|uniref:Uncharacterized protein n=1 Tax=Vigna unguiculata TaxID=3917 RepID=A0A4D6NT36_VIGUN|nr:hypothetical protein DEO72_LG11g1923 [Vigna unguiculata]
MSFRTQLEECHVLNPYPELNSRDTFRSQLKGYIPISTQGAPTNPPLKHHQKPCRSRLHNQQPKVVAAKSPSGGHVPSGAAASRPPGKGHALQAP